MRGDRQTLNLCLSGVGDVSETPPPGAKPTIGAEASLRATNTVACAAQPAILVRLVARSRGV
jgi:hypothetical protein